MRGILRWTVTAAAVVVFVQGCGSTKQFYDGPKRASDELAVLRPDLETGVRIVGIDSFRVEQPEEAGPDVACFKGKIALLPGSHTLQVMYHTSYYNLKTEGADRTTMTYLTSEKPKVLTFEAFAGHTYRVEAKSQPADWPPGAIDWNTWVVEVPSGAIMASTDQE